MILDNSNNDDDDRKSFFSLIFSHQMWIENVKKYTNIKKANELSMNIKKFKWSKKLVANNNNNNKNDLIWFDYHWKKTMTIIIIMCVCVCVKKIQNSSLLVWTKPKFYEECLLWINFVFRCLQYDWNGWFCQSIILFVWILMIMMMMAQ